jgi:hypothetical protein
VDVDGFLVPSGVAMSSAARARATPCAHPHPAESGLFGTVKDRSYDDLVADTLAMQRRES